MFERSKDDHQSFAKVARDGDGNVISDRDGRGRGRGKNTSRGGGRGRGGNKRGNNASTGQ